MPHKDRSIIGTSPNRPRCVYQQGTQLESMCRVCLTKSNTLMFDLCDSFPVKEDDIYIYSDLSIHNILEKITGAKISLYKSPHYICPVCFSILKMSWKFIHQFESSQEKLKQMLGENEVVYASDNLKIASENSSKYVGNEGNYDTIAPVELIVGKNKYSLNDLLVVEKPEEENCDFKGFLNNLGTEVSATFVDENKSCHFQKTDNEHQISLSLVENDKVLPLKELQLDEETNTIKLIVVENDHDHNEEEILTFEIESDHDENEEYKKIEDDNLYRLCSNNITENIYTKTKKEMSNVQNNSDDEDIFDKEVKFPCDMCGKVYEFLDRLKAHKRRIHFKKLKVYFCDICGYKNNTLSAHKHHKTKHIGKKWICEICDKSYYTKAVLKVHMVTHTDNRQHLCTVCGKGFNYANALIYHMRLHTGEKNYLCKFCGQRFRMPNSLNRHLRVHTGERPYHCQFCEKAFRSKGELNCHESCHTGRRPYHCKYCRKGFSKTHNLKLHLLSHEGPHKCDLCCRNFIEPTILTMHYKISHQDLIERKPKEGDKESSTHPFF